MNNSFTTIQKVLDEDIVCTPGNRGVCDERTGVNEPLVCLLSRPRHRRVAKFGMDKP